MALNRSLLKPSPSLKYLCTTHAGSNVNFDTLEATVREETRGEFLVLPPVVTGGRLRSGQKPWAAAPAAGQGIIDAFQSAACPDALRWIAASSGHTWAIRSAGDQVYRLDSLGSGPRALGATGKYAFSWVAGGTLMVFPVVHLTSRTQFRVTLQLIVAELKALAGAVEALRRNPATCATVPTASDAMELHIAGCVGAVAWWISALDRLIMQCIQRRILDRETLHAEEPWLHALQYYSDVVDGFVPFDRVKFLASLHALASSC